MTTAKTFKAALAFALAIAVGLIVGCGDDAPVSDIGGQVDVTQLLPPAVADEVGPELTAAEQQALQQQFRAEASQEITAANAETVAAQLEREIDAELAAE